MSNEINLTKSYEISNSEFKNLSQLVYDQVGIHLAEQKKMLVKTRLSKRLRELNFSTFNQYYQFLKNDQTGEELILFINAISTNVTSFFREPSQWDFLEKEIKEKEASGQRKLRIWSSACSSGQEPYTIAIFLYSLLKNPQEWDIKILATDISEDILKQAMRAQYSLKDVTGIPKNMLNKFFNKVNMQTKTGVKEAYEIKSVLRNLVLFRSFNLVYGNYKGIPKRFDMIFCRNVMIYFDNETKEKVVNNLTSKIIKNGLFFIGHSESLINMKDNKLKLVKPSIYRVPK